MWRECVPGMIVRLLVDVDDLASSISWRMWMLTISRARFRGVCGCGCGCGSTQLYRRGVLYDSDQWRHSMADPKVTFQARMIKQLLERDDTQSLYYGTLRQYCECCRMGASDVAWSTLALRAGVFRGCSGCSSPDPPIKATDILSEDISSSKNSTFTSLHSSSNVTTNLLLAPTLLPAPPHRSRG